ncbi:MAG: ABC transporter permease subunit [Candidatus Latescibacteria bacterium]|nr:ABC transporter permease subunit [Candidatus Latescibacterota bacterium]
MDKYRDAVASGSDPLRPFPRRVLPHPIRWGAAQKALPSPKTLPSQRPIRWGVAPRSLWLRCPAPGHADFPARPLPGKGLGVISPPLFLLFLFLLILPCWGESGLERIRRSGEIHIGTDATYPPFESKVGEVYEGFDIDLGEAVARRLGVRVLWTNVSFDGIFPGLIAGKYDMIISAVTITPERQAEMAFCAPYYDAGQILCVRKEEEGTLSPIDLTGKAAGVQINTTSQYMLERQGGVDIRKYASMDLALLDLQQGRISAVVGDAPTIQWMITRSFPGLKMVGELLTQDQYGFVCRKEDPDLVAAVDQALAQVRAEGEYEKFHAKWFGEEEKPERGPSLADQLLPVLWKGLIWTLQLTAAAYVLALPLGLAVALLRLAPYRPVSWLAATYVELLRGTPLLVQIFFAYFVLPAIGLTLTAWAAGVAALGVNASAYIAEICRAGVLSIEKGQNEAARSLGMTSSQSMRYVVLPQALRRMVPPLTNEAVAMLKDSSLVSVMGLTELTRAGQELAGRYADPLAVWPMVALFYFVATFLLTRLASWMEERYGKGRAG